MISYELSYELRSGEDSLERKTEERQLAELDTVWQEREGQNIGGEKRGGFWCGDRNSKSPLSYGDIMSLDQKGKNKNNSKAVGM